MTRKELIDYININNGLAVSFLEKFKTEDLQKAYDSLQGAYVYLKALSIVQKKNKE